MKEFEEFAGKTVALYGVDNNCFKIGFKKKTYVFEAVEDPDDGYRSFMESIEVKDPEGLVFFKRPVARAEIRDSEQYDGGYEFVDDDGHVWLTFGTDYTDSYYPYFVFAWRAKEPQRGD